MKINSCPEFIGAQTKGLVAPHVLLTLRILSSNRVPGPPFRGTKVFMKADIRRVLIPVAGMGRTFPETFQFGSLVSPALWTGGSAPPVPKLTTDESKVKSPWNPT
jgi:hypothetical protein